MNSEPLKLAAATIKHGGIVAYPTESCYGLGCDPRNIDALRRLLEIKHRPADMGVILIAHDLVQLEPYLDPSATAVLDKPRQSWPGPYTWLLPARESLPFVLRGRHSTIAVRVTAHPLAAALCRYSGRAIVSTSANRHGRSPCLHARRVKNEFADGVDFILQGALGKQAKPTEIRDASSQTIIRQG